MQNKKQIRHDSFNKNSALEHTIVLMKKYGLTEHIKYYSAHRVEGLLNLYVEIASDVDKLIMFKDFLYQFNYKTFLEKFDDYFYICVNKKNITNSQIALFLGFYRYFYVEKITRFLINCFDIIIDEKKGNLPDKDLELASFAKKEALEITDNINKYGDIAVEFWFLHKSCGIII